MDHTQLPPHTRDHCPSHTGPEHYGLWCAHCPRCLELLTRPHLVRQLIAARADDHELTTARTDGRRRYRGARLPGSPR